MSDIRTELRTLKSRLSRVQDVFNSLPQTPPGAEAWPFWLEKLNALSGHYSGLERELEHAEALAAFLVEPAGIPSDPSAVLDSVPNILLRTKLTPEVEADISIEGSSLKAPLDASGLKLYRGACRALQERFAAIHSELQAQIAEDSTASLAAELSGKTSAASSQVQSGLNSKVGSTESIASDGSGANAGDEDVLATLESALRYIYTGH